MMERGASTVVVYVESGTNGGECIMMSITLENENNSKMNVIKMKQADAKGI